MSKVIVAIDQGTREERNAITSFLQAKAWPVWHWIEDLWLVAGVPDDVTSKQLYEELQQNPLLATKRCLIMKIPANTPETHFGRSQKEAWEWMAKFWGRVG